MTQVTNQGDAFYFMKYLGGDTKITSSDGSTFRGLIKDEAYEVYLERSLKNNIPPLWRLSIFVPNKGDVLIYYYDIKHFTEEWKDE
jgi:hypothetical protein